MKIGDYVRTKYGIDKIQVIKENFMDADSNFIATTATISGDKVGNASNGEVNGFTTDSSFFIKSSSNIIELIEYMDLLWLKHPIKLYGSDTMIGLFNPVRCDGFTTFEDGTHCIILNLDYIVDIKDLKIKSILTHEQYEKLKYEVGD